MLDFTRKILFIKKDKHDKDDSSNTKCIDFREILKTSRPSEQEESWIQKTDCKKPFTFIFYMETKERSF